MFRVLYRKKALRIALVWILILFTLIHLYLLIIQLHYGVASVRFQFLTVVFGGNNLKYHLNTKHTFNNNSNYHKQQQIDKLPLQSTNTTVKQQCNIPNLDPFHVDVRRFIHYTWRNKKCPLWPQRGKIVHGNFTLSIPNAQRAGFYYVYRKNDDENIRSPWQSLRDTNQYTLEKEIPSCLMTAPSNLLVLPMLPSAKVYKRDDLSNNQTKHIAIVATKGHGCLDKYQFIFSRDGTIRHANSGRCVVPREDILHKPLVLSINQTQCKHQHAQFELQQDGTIKHAVSGGCFVVSMMTIDAGFFVLNNCSEATKIHFQQNNYMYENLNVTVPLQSDIIKVEYVIGHTFYEEYFVYPLKKSVSKKRQRLQEKVRKDQDRLNVLFFMIDSISRASAQRYLNASYKMLEQDPNSVIMKGHTIVGDGTTAQVLAMFIGEKERNLPEARRGFNNSNYVNRWPWIWKDFEKLGYTTLYGEDSAEIGTFNYRLRGFDKPPTTKYLRPWWIETDKALRAVEKISTACPHKFTFKYLKDLFKTHKDEKKFLFHASNLGHNEPSRATSIDEDLVDFFQHLNKTNELNNTIIVVFGDHGDRTARFRITMQGKLEERLPFLSITLPSWFHRRHPRAVRNLKRNAGVLTSHYDVFATSQHLLTFPELPVKHHRFGKSLFTDIEILNRKCEQAGVEETWCPCLLFDVLKPDDGFVIKLTLQIVTKINTELFKSKVFRDNCLGLNLRNIIRAGKKVTSKKVETFIETFEDEKCNECGMSFDKKVEFHKQIYEIVFDVTPSGGKFEVTVEYDTQEKQLLFADDFLEKISRLNKYGNQPKCIAKRYPYFRKFCYCINSQG